MKPTVLSPWYVVQRLHWLGISGDADGMEYYTHGDEGKAYFQTSPKLAMLFMDLRSAARVAEIVVAEVRVLTTEAEGKEFGR